MRAHHDGPDHDVRRCRLCRALTDDATRRLIGARTRRWYASAVYGRSSRLIAGPFDSSASAIAALPSVRDRVATDYAHDPRASFAGFGIASSFDSLPTLYGAN